MTSSIEHNMTSYDGESVCQLTVGIAHAAVLLQAFVGSVGDDEVGDVEPILPSIKFEAADTFVTEFPENRSGLEMVQRILDGCGSCQNL